MPQVHCSVNSHILKYIGYKWVVNHEFNNDCSLIVTYVHTCTTSSLTQAEVLKMQNSTAIVSSGSFIIVLIRKDLSVWIGLAKKCSQNQLVTCSVSLPEWNRSI